MIKGQKEPHKPTAGNSCGLARTVSSHYSGRRSISLIVGFIIDLEFICFRVALFICIHIRALMLFSGNFI
jgi:hypothetical protein